MSIIGKYQQPIFIFKHLIWKIQRQNSKRSQKNWYWPKIKMPSPKEGFVIFASRKIERNGCYTLEWKNVSLLLLNSRGREVCDPRAAAQKHETGGKSFHFLICWQQCALRNQLHATPTVFCERQLRWKLLFCSQAGDERSGVAAWHIQLGASLRNNSRAAGNASRFQSRKFNHRMNVSQSLGRSCMLHLITSNWPTIRTAYNVNEKQSKLHEHNN